MNRILLSILAAAVIVAAQMLLFGTENSVHTLRTEGETAWCGPVVGIILNSLCIISFVTLAARARRECASSYLSIR